MRRRLWCFGALLVVTLAVIAAATYGQVSTGFSLTVNPPSSIPAPGVAAGFNTTVLDYDMTQSNPWSVTTNWLQCHDGTGGGADPLFYNNWQGFGSFQFPSCSLITWENDPFGKLVTKGRVSYFLIAPDTAAAIRREEDMTDVLVRFAVRGDRDYDWITYRSQPDKMAAAIWRLVTENPERKADFERLMETSMHEAIELLIGIRHEWPPVPAKPGDK